MDKKPVKEILQWDTVNWSKALEFWERNISPEEKNLKCLELGCREGGLSLWLALKGYSVVASDLHDAGTTASPLHRKYHVEDRITYLDINALSIPYENYFDIVVFKSILGGIGRNGNKENQSEVIRQIHKALKPGGKLFFAENTRATKIHEFARKKFTGWGQSWRYVSVQEMGEFLRPFSGYSMNSAGFTGTFGRTENQKAILGYIDRYFFNWMMPRSWKYIVYGVAKK